MSDEDIVLSEIRDIAKQLRGVRARMDQCEDEAKELLRAAQRATGRLTPARLGDHWEQHMDVLRLIERDGWRPLEQVGQALGRGRKSIRISVERLAEAGMLQKEGRKYLMTAVGKASVSVTNSRPF